MYAKQNSESIVMKKNQSLQPCFYIICVIIASQLANITNCAANLQLEDFATIENIKDEIYIQEDRDYPLNKAETYSGVDNVAGITVLPSNDVVLFHRADRDLTSGDTSLFYNSLIKNNTIIILSGIDGSEIVSFGSNLFKMPHGIASDLQGNLWVTDIFFNKVFRLPVGQVIRDRNWAELREGVLKPDIILSGDDKSDFLGPSEVKLPLEGFGQNNLVYVSDGYGNQRIVVFDQAGKHVKTFGQYDIPRNGLVHSITLVERRNMICAADRENKDIYCFNAGLDGELKSIGNLICKFNYPFGAVYSIVALGPNNLLVSSRRDKSHGIQHLKDVDKFDIATLSLINAEVKPAWVSDDLAYPHSMAKSMDGSFVYVADLRKGVPKKVYQFKIIKGKAYRLE